MTIHYLKCGNCGHVEGRLIPYFVMNLESKCPKCGGMMSRKPENKWDDWKTESLQPGANAEDRK